MSKLNLITATFLFSIGTNYISAADHFKDPTLTKLETATGSSRIETLNPTGHVTTSPQTNPQSSHPTQPNGYSVYSELELLLPSVAALPKAAASVMPPNLILVQVYPRAHPFNTS